jgi:hypothetical protein
MGLSARSGRSGRGTGRDVQSIDYNALGAAEGHAFSYASYEYSAKDGGPLGHRWIIIFERLAPGLLRAVVAPDTDPAFYFGKPRLLHARRHTLL